MEKIIEISDNLKIIKGENEGRYPHSNSLLVEDEKVALIDTGAGGEKMKELAEEREIDIIINSHCHEDHIPHNDLFDSQIYIHESEMYVLKNLDELANIYTPKGSGKWDEVSGFLHDFVVYEGLEDVFGFGDRHVFDLGGTKLKVVHTPGHSKGHCAFLDPDEGGVIFGRC